MIGVGWLGPKEREAKSYSVTVTASTYESLKSLANVRSDTREKSLSVGELIGELVQKERLELGNQSE